MKSGVIVLKKSEIIEKAKSLIKQHQFADALTLLKQFNTNPQPKIVQHMIAKCFEKLERFQDAIKLNLEICNTWPDDTKTLLNLAFCYEKTKKNDKALKTYQQILRIDPKFITARTSYAHFLESYDKEAAKVQYEILAKQKPNDSAMFITIARLYQSLGQYTQAREYLFKIKDYKLNQGALLCLVRCYDEENKDKEAENVFRHLLKTFPNFKEGLLAFARFNQKTKNHKKAIECYQKLVKQSPHDFTVLLSYARCNQEMRNYKEAINILQKIPDYGNNLEALIAIARIYEEMKEDEQAQKIFILLYEKWPTHPLVLIGYSRFLQRNGHFNDALELLNRILNHEQNLEAALGKARCIESLDDLPLALATYFEMLKTWPDNKAVLLGMVRVYESMGKYDKSLDLLENMRKTSPTDKVILLAFAYSYEGMGQYSQALMVYDYLRNLYPRDDEVLMSLVCCYQYVGEFDKALETIDTALSYYPDERKLLLSKGIVLCSKRDYLSGLRMYQFILSKFPQDRETLLALARCYHEQCQYDKALLTLTSIRHYQFDKSVLTTMSYCYAKSRNRIKGENLNEYMLSKWPNDNKVKLAVSRFYRKMRDFKRAESCVKTIPNWEKHRSALISLCNIYLESNQLDKLQETIDMGLVAHPFEVVFIVFQTKRHIKTHDIDAAIDNLFNQEKVFSYSTYIPLYLVYLYLLIGETKHAISLSQKYTIKFHSHKQFLDKMSGIFFKFKVNPALFVHTAVEVTNVNYNATADQVELWNAKPKLMLSMHPRHFEFSQKLKQSKQVKDTLAYLDLADGISSLSLSKMR